VYKKAVIRMRYYTEIWYEGFFLLSLDIKVNMYDNRFMAYTWTNSVGKHDEAMSILRAGMEANPRRFVHVTNLQSQLPNTL
jgi:cleavage stimulation factor subunit 3